MININISSREKNALVTSADFDRLEIRSKSAPRNKRIRLRSISLCAENRTPRCQDWNECLGRTVERSRGPSNNWRRICSRADKQIVPWNCDQDTARLIGDRTEPLCAAALGTEVYFPYAVSVQSKNLPEKKFHSPLLIYRIVSQIVFLSNDTQTTRNKLWIKNTKTYENK